MYILQSFRDCCIKYANDIWDLLDITFPGQPAFCRRLQSRAASFCSFQALEKGLKPRGAEFTKAVFYQVEYRVFFAKRIKAQADLQFEKIFGD